CPLGHADGAGGAARRRESLFSELGGDAQQLFGWRQGVGDGDNCVEEDEEVEEILEEEGDADDGGKRWIRARSPRRSGTQSAQHPVRCACRPRRAAAPRAPEPCEDYDDDDVEIDDEAYLRSTLSDLSSPPYLPHDDEYEYDYEGDYAVGAAGGIGPVEMDEMRGEVLEGVLPAAAACAPIWDGGAAAAPGGSQPGKTPDELAIPPPPAGCRRRWWRVCKEQRGARKIASWRPNPLELQRPRQEDSADAERSTNFKRLLRGYRQGYVSVTVSVYRQVTVSVTIKVTVRLPFRLPFRLPSAFTVIRQVTAQVTSEGYRQVTVNRMTGLTFCFLTAQTWFDPRKSPLTVHSDPRHPQTPAGLQEQLARMNAEVASVERSDSGRTRAVCAALAEPESFDLSQSLASAARSSPANHNGPPAKK
uniref:SH2 domain-containing protein n=1 Tax=Macrostomum lignano TaxID=282301 RepID=A0A1I8FJ14_9PLAT